jgi:predicted metal-binding membrane protein
VRVQPPRHDTTGRGGGWQHPLPLLAVSATAWLLLAGPAALSGLPELCSSALIWSVPAPETFAFFLSQVSPLSLLLAWVVMLVAMMLPLVADTLAHVRRSAFPPLRLPMQAAFLAGYLAVWLLAGIALVAASVTVRLGAGQGTTIPVLIGLAIAILWQMSPAKQRALNRCHRYPPLSAFAPQAQRDALRLGLDRGLWCLSSCWALMLLALLAPGGHLVVMATVALWIWAERLDPPAPARWGLHLPRRALRLTRRMLALPLHPRRSSPPSPAAHKA